MINYHFSWGWRRTSCWDRKWRKMWEGWRRTSSALTPDSVTLSWTRPNETWRSLHKTSLSVRSVIHSFVTVWGRTSQTRRLSPILNMLTKIWDCGAVTQVLPPSTPPWGATSHTTIICEMLSSHRPPTCPQPAKSCCFPSRHPFNLIPWLWTILDPKAEPCGQRSQAPEEPKFEIFCCTDDAAKCSDAKGGRKL